MIAGFSDATPLARHDDLVVEHLGDEVLVYDIASERAHCLNATAALVWQNCDGHTSVAQLGQLLEEHLHFQGGEQLAALALKQLSRNRLLTDEHAGHASALISRRSLIRGLGLAAGSLPLITSILSPTPAQAATCLSPGQACTTSAECCSALCNTPTNTCA
jgi:hypothetical protein